MQLDAILILVNLIVYASVAAGLIEGRRRSATIVGGQEAIFRQLESVLKKRFPDLPEGFTMREGLSRVKSLGLDLSWDPLERALEGYEAYRYGGGPAPSGTQPELARLIRRLGRAW